METNQKQYSAACERNRGPILEQLLRLLAQSKTVLEIGSGTGQHAVFFAEHLPQLRWHTSDRLANHASIVEWMKESNLCNIAAPIELDVGQHEHWPETKYDAAFTANTCHIMAWEEVKRMFVGLRNCLETQALLIIYGPFNYGGQFTSSSNQVFHQNLQSQASHMGIRDIEDLIELGKNCHFQHIEDIEMPANNRLLVFQKTT